MADTLDTDTETETQPKKRGKLLIVLLGLAVLVGGGVAGGLYWTKSAHAEAAAPGPKLVPKSEQKRPAAKDGEASSGGEHPKGVGGDKYASNYYSMGKEFTSNLKESVHFIQVGVAVSTPYDDSVIENLKTNDIAVRSAVLMTLGDTTEEEVFTSDGKEKLARRITAAINATLKQKEGFGGISNTYFTSFVVQ